MILEAEIQKLILKRRDYSLDASVIWAILNKERDCDLAL
jgi:hypothetical protein